MCDDAGTEEIDEFIEYELTKDCDDDHEDVIEEVGEDDDDDEDGQIILEEVIAEEEELELEHEMLAESVGLLVQNDISHDGVDEEVDPPKPLVLTETMVQMMGVLKHEPKEERLDYGDGMLLEPEEEEEEDDEYEEMDETEALEEHNRQQRPNNVSAEEIVRRGPSRYLLFDELVATIVDYDDNTPIVEFAMSGLDEDERLPVECGICPDVMHKEKLTRHLKTHLKPGTTKYQCIYCEESYKDYKYLAGHARRHMGIRPYVCEPCKLYFSTKQDMRVHNQRRHSDKEHICEICGKTFSQNTMLKRHRESSHEKRRRFQCELCPKGYYKNFSLQEHVRNVHEGKRRMLVCPFCGMQCRDAHKMARHRKALHLNQTHFECQICQEEFSDVSYFDAHKRSIQCRNNTSRRKLEENELQLQQQQQQQQQLVQKQEELDELQVQQQQLVHEVVLGQEEFLYEITLENSEVVQHTDEAVV